MEVTKYKNPCVTVDAIIEDEEGFTLVKRGKEPFKGMWALPGGHLEYGESLEKAAARETFEETGYNVTETRLVNVYSEPGRDPRGHYVSAVFACKVEGVAKAGDDADEVRKFPGNALPPLAFDHADMIKDYKEWKRRQKND